ncbi:MAG: hypothetical protein HT579_04445 [Candidatus Accumulibacter similis]|nr:MAG: hypothetical protein HT579_04445 [Candidatus Accumulibacter similis]
MNALFAPEFKGFLTLPQAQDAVRQDHGDGAHRTDGRVVAGIVFGGHEGLYRLSPRFVSATLGARRDSGARHRWPSGSW